MRGASRALRGSGLLLLALAGLCAAQTPTPPSPADLTGAATYTLDPAHSFVQFELMHFGTSTIRGRFGPARGVVRIDRVRGRGEASIEIDTASADTGLAAFDAHLRAIDPAMGVRDAQALDRMARPLGLEPLADRAMPAENRLLVFVRRGGGSGA